MACCAIEKMVEAVISKVVATSEKQKKAETIEFVDYDGTVEVSSSDET